MILQSELILEQDLINQLTSNGYDKVVINDENELFCNLKKQLEQDNNIVFSDRYLKKI